MSHHGFRVLRFRRCLVGFSRCVADVVDVVVDEDNDDDDVVVVVVVVVVAAVLGCGYPGSPSHATVNLTPALIRPGTAANYECEPGFELLGPSRRICSTNGTWTPAGIPFCGESRHLPFRNEKKTTRQLPTSRPHHIKSIFFFQHGPFLSNQLNPIRHL